MGKAHEASVWFREEYDVKTFRQPVMGTNKSLAKYGDEENEDRAW